MKKSAFKNLIALLILAPSISFAGVFLELLPNTNKIYRSRAPKNNEYVAIKQAGINTVIIFKNQLKTEVDDEVKLLNEIGISSDRIYKIPFKWKNVLSFKNSCEQTMTALKILVDVQNSPNDKAMFHCTVGEDRTGVLAGLMSQLLGVGGTDQVYQSQMCDKGYASGNKAKPFKVSSEVYKNLNPTFMAISNWIEQGLVTFDNIDLSLCAGKIDLSKTLTDKTCESLN